MSLKKKSIKMDFPNYNKLYLDHDPKLKHVGKDEIILITNNAFFRFHISGNNLCVFGDFGTGIYCIEKMTWYTIQGMVNAPFSYFLEKCIASTYGKYWVDGEYRHKEEEPEPKPHAWAWGQYLATKKLIELLALS